MIVLIISLIMALAVAAEAAYCLRGAQERNGGRPGGAAVLEESTEAPETQAPETETLPPETETETETEPETFPPPVTEIDPNRPVIALTFDDGPQSANTSRLLDILRENGAHATFFVVGYALDGNEEIVRRAYEEGNEIASHTLNHPHLTSLSDAEIDQEIGGMRQRIVDITGQQTVLLRPPYGETDERVIAHITDPIILWSVDTRDWAEKDVDSIFGHIQNDIFDGAIILMHDIHSTTIDAAEVFIPWLREQGYQMVTVSELGQYREGGLEAGVRYGALRPAETEAAEEPAEEPAAEPAA